MTLLKVLSCSQLALNLCFISVKCKRHTEKRLKYFTVWLSYHEFESCSLIIRFLFTRKAKVCLREHSYSCSTLKIFLADICNTFLYLILLISAISLSTLHNSEDKQ